MKVIFCVVATLLLVQSNVLSAGFLFADDFENPKDFDKKWLMISNWELREEKGNHFAEKLDEQGQVDLEVKDMTFTAPFTVQMRLKQVNADAGAHPTGATGRIINLETPYQFQHKRSISCLNGD